MESYITIRHHAEFEYEDRKSIFIAEAMPVETEAEALAFIDSVKKKYSQFLRVLIFLLFLGR